MTNQLKLITAYIRKAKRRCPLVVVDTDEGKRLDTPNKFEESILDSFDLPYCDYIFKIINKQYPYDDPVLSEEAYAEQIYYELKKAKEELDNLKDIAPEDILKYAARDYNPDDDKCKANNILPILKIGNPIIFYQYYLYYEVLIERKEPAMDVLKELYAAEKYCWLLHDFYYEHDVRSFR